MKSILTAQIVPNEVDTASNRPAFIDKDWTSIIAIVETRTSVIPTSINFSKFLSKSSLRYCNIKFEKEYDLIWFENGLKSQINEIILPMIIIWPIKLGPLDIASSIAKISSFRENLSICKVSILCPVVASGSMLKIKELLSRDYHIDKLFKKYQGLRIIRQDPFQCIISFICASNNNIARIRKMLYNICKLFGKSIEFDSKKFNLFPTSRELYRASTIELQNCGLGYRAKYVKSITEKIHSKELDLDSLKKSSYQNAKTELMKNFGIGNKTADCILLFSLEKTTSFPIDTWIVKSLINNYYWLLKKHVSPDIDKKISNSKTYNIIQREIRNYFGYYSGYAQQYLYYDIRNKEGKKWWFNFSCCVTKI